MSSTDLRVTVRAEFTSPSKPALVGIPAEMTTVVPDRLKVGWAVREIVGRLYTDGVEWAGSLEFSLHIREVKVAPEDQSGN